MACQLLRQREPAGKQKLRALLAATDRLTQALTAADWLAFAPGRPPEVETRADSKGEEILS